MSDTWSIERERICGAINRGHSPQMEDIAAMLGRCDELAAALRWFRDHGSKHGVPDEVWAIVQSVPDG